MLLEIALHCFRYLSWVPRSWPPLPRRRKEPLLCVSFWEGNILVLTFWSSICVLEAGCHSLGKGPQYPSFPTLTFCYLSFRTRCCLTVNTLWLLMRIRIIRVVRMKFALKPAMTFHTVHLKWASGLFQRLDFPFGPLSTLLVLDNYNFTVYGCRLGSRR